MTSDGTDTPSTRPPRQEKERATTEITELAPGVLRSQLPVELPGLGHVNCYLLEDDRGVALVDPGLPGDRAWAALVDRLGRAGYGVENVHTVICTHSHHDHFGGAERLREEAGATIVTHESFGKMWIRPGDPEFAEFEAAEEEARSQAGLPDDFPRRRRMRTPWGTVRKPPPDEVINLMKQDNSLWFEFPEPDRHVADGHHITLARREWVAVHTPGHTADHLCLYDPEAGIMISGDHVLPTITPHIGSTHHDVDPLQQFFDSLDRMHDFADVNLVLPAHGHPFDDLSGRAQAICDHHHERLDEICDAAVERDAETVTEYMQAIFRERSWGDMAESETYAHLDHLRRTGRMGRQESDEGQMTFHLAAEAEPENPPAT